MDVLFIVYTSLYSHTTRNVEFLNVVVTLSFNAKMVLANFECNLNDYLGTPRNGPEKVTCLLWERRGSGPEKQ